MRIAMTGGGTAGHAMVNCVLMPELKKREWEILYIGSKDGLEKNLVERMSLAPYYGISTGKLRRYVTWRHFGACFSVIKGIIEAWGILKKEMPNVILSGGGYVSVPVVIAAKLRGIPVVIRETDYTMGLANKICVHFADKVFVTFEETLKQLSGVVSDYCGMLIRPELLRAKEASFNIEQRKTTRIRPVLLIMGGSLGAASINRLVHDNLKQLLEHYNVIHICGKGHVNEALGEVQGYQQHEFVEDMGPLYAYADVVVTRSGSNAICEGLALGKRLVCLPLSSNGSRGEQLDNARVAVQKGCAVILEEKEMNLVSLRSSIERVLKQPLKDTYILNEENLKQNCEKQMAALKTLALENLESGFINYLHRNGKVNWKGLSEEDQRIYEELAADCWG